MAEVTIFKQPVQVQVKFWENVPKGLSEAECWPWSGGVTSAGYGRVTFAGKNWVASRIMAEMKAMRQLGEDEAACHTCDNPVCVNPSHIFIGSYADNIRDMWEKGRANVEGALSDDEVLHIWSLRDMSRGASGRVAKKLGLGRLTVWRIWNGVSYRHLTEGRNKHKPETKA